MPVVNTPKPLTGARKAAIVMMALGEEHSSKLLRHLDEHEIERIAREVSAIGKVAPDVGEAVLLEFDEMATVSEHVAIGGVEYARRLVSKSVSPEASRRILERVLRSFAARAGFHELAISNRTIKTLGRSRIVLVPGYLRDECRELFDAWLRLPQKSSY